MRRASGRRNGRGKKKGSCLSTVVILFIVLIVISACAAQCGNSDSGKSASEAAAGLSRALSSEDVSSTASGESLSAESAEPENKDSAAEGAGDSADEETERNSGSETGFPYENITLTVEDGDAGSVKITIPAFDGKSSVPVNGDVPFFTMSDLEESSYEKYSDLDALGRCGTAQAVIGQDLMPTEPRGEIGMIRPSGWHTVKYAGIDGNYLYNRCHLIAYELTGENANEKNLITGTRYMNIEGMSPYENETADYIKATDNHVLYRVTPVFEGNNLLSYGVLMEGESVEDEGEEVEFCVFCYNVEPGITIDYSDGSSEGEEYKGTSRSVPDGSGSTSKSAGEEASIAVLSEGTEAVSSAAAVSSADSRAETDAAPYVGNANAMKFHYSWCESVGDMKEKNRVYFETREEAVEAGYVPCKRCNP